MTKEQAEIELPSYNCNDKKIYKHKLTDKYFKIDHTSIYEETNTKNYEIMYSCSRVPEDCVGDESLIPFGVKYFLDTYEESKEVS